jgi:lipoprotein-anchoring transpeptidase ErfK/SrfK
LKRFLLTSALALTVNLSAATASPVVPWAQPQTSPSQDSTEKPLWDQVMEEERRQKERGITGPVNADSLKPNRPALQSAPANQQSDKFIPLERGAQGPRVKAAQQALLSLGFGLPAGADGDYGGQTEASVKAFQSSVDLPLTGKLDYATYQKLSEVSPAQGKMIWEDPLAARSLPAPADVSGKKVRVLIDLSEHRLSVYDSSGQLQRVFPVASGAKETPTDTGIKVVCEKLDDPTALAQKLWPESKGTAFGKRLIDLNWYDPKSGARSVSDEELHGTYELNSIGNQASHGCVRLTNESIEWLYKNLQLGDVVLIRE